MSQAKRILVGQSGGPTSAINASLAGVIAGAREKGVRAIGMRYGIQGFLDGRTVDLDQAVPDDDALAALKELGLNISDCAGILVTHEHSDHVKGLATFLKKNPLPVYGADDTLDFLDANGIVPASFLSHERAKFLVFQRTGV